ncbi:hypothetical protein LZY01_19640 [Levilactobacillus zymae]|uniref:Uncharacterized protein n=1 Tax=Levilactobacillus zymae TaxID=267363 RepID=A0ABQ0WYK5_9LACO|nr:CD1375 family protein [Levilactobacillus zymae]GEO72796.1 hypothetical protein LZY01_19640 [Levilactobacillus zymae]
MKFSALAQVYADSIKRGDRTIEQVPAQLKDDVSNLITQK